jgi:two-component system NarL family sensor kinase
MAASRADPPVVRRAVLALLLTALLAFAVVGTAATIVAHRIAEADALAESARTARALGDGLFGPALPAVLAGDIVARTLLDTAVRDRARDGAIVTVKVWNRDGVVVYSDQTSLIGRRFASDSRLRRVLDGKGSVATLSDLLDEEPAGEAGRFDRLVETYVPLRLDDGSELALEIYSTDRRVVVAGSRLTRQLVPFALSAMLVLLLAQLPVALWLVRRVGRAQVERARLLRNALSASDRERRSIARDLHDGVVPELAGVGYALESLASATAPVGPERIRRLMLTAAMVRGAVAALRTLMIDIYPPDLTAAGLHAVIEELAQPLREAGVEVVVRSLLTAEPSPDVSGALYRGARECLRNIARHAEARHVRVELRDDAEFVRLRITDDGVGLPVALLAADPGDFPAGHLGVRLLRETTADLGGTIRLSNRLGGGAAVVMELPAVAPGPQARAVRLSRGIGRGSAGAVRRAG